jgi:predicted ATPase/DNA-binding SARP family transcriptional activator/DNA-binding CsgD family transcriptional regulator
VVRNQERKMDPQRATAGRRDPSPEAVRVWLLGGFRVSVGSRSIGEEEWRLRKAGSLVKLLALAPGHRLHREQAMELLWPGLDPQAAANNLHHALHVARRFLEPAAADTTAACRHLHLRHGWFALCPEGPVWVDVEAFEEAAATARHAREPAAYRAAIALYAGELLPEERYEAWAEERRAQLRGAYLSLLVELARVYEERKEFGRAIETLSKVVAEEPTREEAQVGLMRMYALSGRRREALGQYERLREALLREFGAEPEAAAGRLQEEIWTGRFPPIQEALPVGPPPEKEPPERGDGRHNLPLARTSFVGREREILEVKRLLAMTLLLTLTGVGGSGKTRLALRVASDLAGAYPDGAWLVELAPLSEPELVPQAVARALKVREQPNRPLLETLKEDLRAKKMLLVVDNCEHLIEAVAHLVDALLGTCPHLRVLATSREALDVAGEVTWVVPSLSVPGPRQVAPTAGELEGYESARLFMERARYRDPSFVLTPQNMQAVAQICRRLDGIPLAIELAAARVGVLSAEQIAERLEDSLKLLSAGRRTAVPRHQTLRAALDWSYDLLAEPEKRLFGRLSVFAGGWTLEAAEVAGAGESIDGRDVLDLLSRLVDKSLVVAEAEAEGTVRYRMLEPVRQYGLELLEAGGEAERVRERHAEHYLALAEAAEPELMGADQASWLERLGTEHANLRAALSWALGPEDAEPRERAELGLQLAATLGRFWNAHSPSEGLGWLERGLARRSSASSPSVRAKALEQAGWIAIWHGDYEEAVTMLEEGLASFKELKDKPGAATLLANLGVAVLQRGDDHSEVTALREEAEALRQELTDRPAIAHLLNFLGQAALGEGDHDRAVAHFEEGLVLYRELGDTRNIAMNFCCVGMTELSLGDRERAATPFEEALRLLRGRGDKVGIAYSLLGLAGVAVSRGLPARAARLWGASEALREADGLPLSPFVRSISDYEGDLAAARAGLDERSFAAAWSEGRAMTPEQATEYALSGEESAPPTLVPVAEQRPLTDEPTETLTPREQEIAVLVERGLTNRRIAEELVISEHTVATHVRKILKKLGLRSRAQIST